MFTSATSFYVNVCVLVSCMLCVHGRGQVTVAAVVARLGGYRTDPLSGLLSDADLDRCCPACV